jgi:hypothetical protein
LFRAAHDLAELVLRPESGGIRWPSVRGRAAACIGIRKRLTFTTEGELTDSDAFVPIRAAVEVVEEPLSFTAADGHDH